MTAGGIEQEFIRDFRLVERGVIELAAGDEVLVVLSTEDQRRRDFRLQVQVRGDLSVLVEVCRVNQHGKVRPAALAVYRVNGWVSPLIESGARLRREISARREAHDSESLRINVPLGRARARLKARCTSCSAPSRLWGTRYFKTSAPIPTEFNRARLRHREHGQSRAADVGDSADVVAPRRPFPLRLLGAASRHLPLWPHISCRGSRCRAVADHAGFCHINHFVRGRHHRQCYEKKTDRGEQFEKRYFEMWHSMTARRAGGVRPAGTVNAVLANTGPGRRARRRACPGRFRNPRAGTAGGPCTRGSPAGTSPRRAPRRA